MGTTESSNRKLNDVPKQLRFVDLMTLQSQINAVSKKIRTSRQVLWNEGALTGPACGCFVLGVDYLTGDLYYKDADGNWQLASTGSSGFDSTVEFSVNANPNTVGTTFDPNTPELTTVIYVSTIDNSLWVWNGVAYVIYTPPNWTTHGNSGTNVTTNFLGTTDNVGLRFRLNNIFSGIISPTHTSSALGYEALRVNTGVGNTAFGYNALKANTTATQNTAFGTNSLLVNTATGNSGFGYHTLFANTTGVNNVAVGRQALLANTTGRENVAMGFSALHQMVSGERNVAIGYNTMQLGTTGNDNTGVGSGALGATTGNNNVGIGLQAGRYNTTASDQIFINSLNRLNYIADQTESPIYIQQNAVVSSQLLRFNGHVIIGGDTSATELRFLEPSASGTNYSSFKAVAQAATINYSLPPTVGAAATVLTDVAGNGVLTWEAAGGGSVVNSIQNFRLTTESGVPVSITDRIAQSTIYLTPYIGNHISLYSGAAWVDHTTAEVSLALSGLTSDTNYDVFAYNNAGTITLELSAAWSDDVTRTDALARQDGVLVKSGTTTHRFIGTIRTTSTTTTEDSEGGTTTQVGGKRFVWNAYNQVRRTAKVIDTTDSWNYNTATWRQENAAAGNQVEYVTGDASLLIEAQYNALVLSTNTQSLVGIGISSTTVPIGFPSSLYTSGTDFTSIVTRYVGTPGLGYYYVAPLEKGTGGTTTFYGDNGTTDSQSGLSIVITN